MDTFDKPFLTYDQMIELLESRGLSIPNKEYAKSVLMNMSYYSLINSYKSFVSPNNDDQFADGLTFDALYTIHTFDISLSNIIFKYILYIEDHLKSSISYIVSKNYGVNQTDYLSKEHYNSGSKYLSGTIEKLNKYFDLNKKLYRSKSFLHYLRNHNHVPAWILTSSIVFGEAISWYRILKNKDKEYVCDSFSILSNFDTEVKKEFLSSALDLLRDFRNVTAHRNMSFNFSNRTPLLKCQVTDAFTHLLVPSDLKLNNSTEYNGIWSVIVAINILLSDTALIYSFNRDLYTLFYPFLEGNIKILGKNMLSIFCLPDDMFARLEDFISAANVLLPSPQ